MRDGWSSGMYRFLHYTDDAVLYVKTKFEEISLQVQVLGALCGRGVPMLLNKRGRVWLYNVPHAIDRPLRNFQTAACDGVEGRRRRFGGQETCTT